MFRKSQTRSLKSSQLAPIADGDLRAVMGGMFPKPVMGPPAPAAPPIIFPPLPAIAPTSFRVPLPAAPSPFSVSTFSSGGTGQTPQHAIGASFNNGKVFANVQVMTPAVPAIPPMPTINGTSSPALQTHSVNAGIKFKF